MQLSETCYVVLLSLTGFILVDAVTKTWIRNTNFINRENWDLKRLPCSSDRIIFKENLDLSIELPGAYMKLREVVLPRSGELLLPLYGEFKITGSSKIAKDCPDPSDITYIISGIPSWLDPQNWRTNEEVNPAVPHINQLPCSGDTASFPADTSVILKLPETPVFVGKITINNQEVSNEDWRSFLLSDIGEKQFIGDEDTRQDAVSVVGMTCTDETGCSCGTFDTIQTVCRVIGNDCPSFVPCYFPIRPIGHCCDICAASLLLDYNTDFKISSLNKSIHDYLETKKYSTIASFVGKAAGTGQVQVVLVDKADYSRAPKDIAQELASIVQKDKSLEIYQVNVQASGPPAIASKLSRTMEIMSGTLFFVVCAIGLIFFVFVVHGGNLPSLRSLGAASPFVFAKYKNVIGENESLAEIAEEEEEEEEATERETATRRLHFQVELGGKEPQEFDNPMFGHRKNSSDGDRTKQKDTKEEKSEHDRSTFSKLRYKPKDETLDSVETSREEIYDVEDFENLVLIDVKTDDD